LVIISQKISSPNLPASFLCLCFNTTEHNLLFLGK